MNPKLEAFQRLLTIIDELREYLTFFKRVDSTFDPIWQRAWHDLGVTQEIIDRELESLGIKR